MEDNKMEIKSILNSILEEINKENDVNKIKEIFINRVKNSRINNKDKISMLTTIQKKHDYPWVMKYIYDCLLKYEGDGVIKS